MSKFKQLIDKFKLGSTTEAEEVELIDELNNQLEEIKTMIKE